MSQLPPLFQAPNNTHTLLITGGLTGIGRAIALTFLSHCANVALNYLAGHNADDADDAVLIESLVVDARAAIRARRTQTRSGTDPAKEEEKEEVDEEVPLLCVAGDISQPETSEALVAQCMSRFGRIDTFVSNAGICRFEDFLAVAPTTFAAHTATNLGGAFFATQSVARRMATQEPDAWGMRGSIIGVSSVSALVGGARQAHYTPTKAGVLSLMQSCAAALGEHGIRCNALLPGTIRTQLNEDDLVGEKKGYMEGRIPLGRLGRPEDMGGPALFLAVGELSGYVNGAAILVDGGAFVNFQ